MEQPPRPDNREWIEEYLLSTPVWVAILAGHGDGPSGEERVVGLDGLPGEGNPDSWARLRERCLRDGTKVLQLGLAFRDHVVWQTRGSGGFYFSKCVSAIPSGPQWYSMVIGFQLENGNYWVEKWRVPELEFEGGDIRVVVDDDPRVIVNRV